jgi:hypothetical protein
LNHNDYLVIKNNQKFLKIKKLYSQKLDSFLFIIPLDTKDINLFIYPISKQKNVRLN